MNNRVKVAIIESKNPLTNEAIYTIVSGDVDALKYSPSASVIEMGEGEVLGFKKSQSEFLNNQLLLQSHFLRSRKEI